MSLVSTEKFSNDLREIMDCFAEVLEDLGHSVLTGFLPWRDQCNKQPVSEASTDRLVQLFSISFQILNMVEENTLIQARRSRQSEGRLEDDVGLWPSILAKLKQAGVCQSELLEVIGKMRVEPVLTAHPTEAKRATVLEHHRELYLLLVQRENTMWTPVEQSWLRDQIRAKLEMLWRTGEIYVNRPDVESEQRNVMHYLKNVFPEVIAWMDRRFVQAWQQSGFDTNAIDLFQRHYPSFSFGSWVGGDRDGHPFVSAKMTESALRDLRLNALIVIRHKLVDLGKKMSFADSLQKPPKALSDRLEIYSHSMPEVFQEASARNPGESWRILVSIMIERLPVEVVRNHATQLDHRPHCYENEAQLLDDASILQRSLIDIGAGVIAENELHLVIRCVQCFGFYSAKLDVRQNSEFHTQAFDQIISTSLGFSKNSFLGMNHAQRREFIHKELATSRSFINPAIEISGRQAKDLLETYQVLSEHIKKYGCQGLGSLIVSMTHSSDDLFLVYLLAREAGLLKSDASDMFCELPVVPLFETVEDLQKSPQILDEFLSHPVTISSLRWQQEKMGLDKPMQQVMIGYSDSSKDGGILASQWSLFVAQTKLAEVANKHEVEICFFHGRGGTVSRGSGPMHRFLDALPVAAKSAYIRMTEQGETISRKYANLATAVYSLETSLAGFTDYFFKSDAVSEIEYSEFMEFLAASSCEHYRKLILDEDFMEFFRAATPIDVLEHARIGSRPPKRTGKSTIDDLRAIPWVFSWNQSRFYLPSWYGVGSALKAYQTQYPLAFEKIQEKIHEYKLLSYVLHNVEVTVASASRSMMQAYANLVENPDIREQFMQKILSEYDLTSSMIEQVFGASIETRRPQVVKTIALREAPLQELHLIQIAQLKKWRQSGEEPMLLDSLLLTINAIAGGLRNTG